MQYRASINKSLNYLNAVENKFDTGNLFTNRENHRDKTSLGDFKVTTPKIPPLSITSSYRNLTKTFGLSRNTNLQLNPYPNT